MNKYVTGRNQYIAANQNPLTATPFVANRTQLNNISAAKAAQSVVSSQIASVGGYGIRKALVQGATIKLAEDLIISGKTIEFDSKLFTEILINGTALYIGNSLLTPFLKQVFSSMSAGTSKLSNAAFLGTALFLLKNVLIEKEQINPTKGKIMDIIVYIASIYAGDTIDEMLPF